MHAALIQYKLQTSDNISKRGWVSQKLMSPPTRSEPDYEQIEKLSPRLSAVMLLIYPINDIMHLVFTERHTYEGVHSGQISLPGGQKELDEDLVDTAIRECFEEIGYQVEKEQVIATLSKIYIPPSNFLVYPYVALLAHRPSFSAQEREVKALLEIPLTTIFHPDNKQEVEIKLAENKSMKVPAYHVAHKIIWGATAIMLSELEQLLS